MHKDAKGVLAYLRGLADLRGCADQIRERKEPLISGGVPAEFGCVPTNFRQVPKTVVLTAVCDQFVINTGQTVEKSTPCVKVVYSEFPQ